MYKWHNNETVMSNFDTYIRRICMKRFISIQEFLDSFKFNEPLYPNTLRYLYNADYQNGLYIDKSPRGSGTSKLINLLVLYRIAKWVTNGDDTPAALEFYDASSTLATKSFLEDLKSSSLFIEENNKSLLKEKVLLDKLHIYYVCSSNMSGDGGYIEFYSDNKVSISFVSLATCGFATPGQPIGKGKFLGIVVKEFHDPKRKEIYKAILDKKLYSQEMDYRLYPEMIHKKPFAIVCCPKLEEYKPINFDNINTIEINCPPNVKEYEGKTTVMDSYGQWDEEKKAEDFDVFLHEYKIKFTKPYHCPVEPSSISIEDCAVISGPEVDKIYEESQTKGSRRETLKRCYGLVEHWDYEFID